MFKKSLIPILCSSLLLLGCDFRPKHKVIQYQEEVKLSDGSFIWVDIKRHYRLAGEPFQKANYLPSIVEISWDMNLGDKVIKNITFNQYISYFDFYNEKYYIIGGNNNFQESNCGKPYAQNIGYIFVFDKSNTCIKLNSWSDFPSNPKVNIAHFASIPEHLDGKKLSWQQKIHSSDYRSFGEVIIQYPF